MARPAKGQKEKEAVSLLKELNYKIIPEGKLACVECGTIITVNTPGNFYRSTSSRHDSNSALHQPQKTNKERVAKKATVKSFCPWCTKCLTSKLEWNKVETLIDCLRLIDKPFIGRIYESTTKRFEKKADVKPSAIFGAYLSTLTLNKEDGTFGDSESWKDESNDEKEDSYYDEEIETLSEDEAKIKEEVVKLLERDPFVGFSIDDQRFLYTDLLGYIDEDTSDDKYKVSQATQLCNNNNQIRKSQETISQYSKDHETMIKNLSDIIKLEGRIKILVDNNKKIAEDNGFSEKHKKNSGAGKNTLSTVMKTLREYGFESGLVNYHNQLMSDSFKRVADISHRSILDQLMLDENDYSEIVTTQRELIKKFENRALKAEEELRKYHESKQVI